MGENNKKDKLGDRTKLALPFILTDIFPDCVLKHPVPMNKKRYINRKD